MKKKSLSKNTASKSLSKASKTLPAKQAGKKSGKLPAKRKDVVTKPLKEKSELSKIVAKNRKASSKTERKSTPISSKKAGPLSKSQKSVNLSDDSPASKKAGVTGKSGVKAGSNVVGKISEKLASPGAEKKEEKVSTGSSIASSDLKKKNQLDQKQSALSKKAATKKGKSAKKDKEEAVDDFVDTEDLLGGESEIAEYEEELQAVEELDDEEGEEDAEFSLEGGSEDENEVILTDAEGRRYCRVKDCDQIAMVDGYCRYHYLLLWRRIQVRKKILADGKLEKYVEELTARYPDKFLEMIRKDLKTEKDFLSAIGELEIDESANESEFEEEAQTFIDEVRGLGEGPTSGVEDEDY
jgi:hypothetical protein